MADLWGIARQLTEREDGLTSGLMRLRLFARSGVEIEILTFTEYGNIMFGRNPTLAQGNIFAEALLTSTWLSSTERQELQSIIVRMMTFYQPTVKSSLQPANNTSTYVMYHWVPR